MRADVPQGEDELTQFLSCLAWTHPESFLKGGEMHPSNEEPPECVICGAKGHTAIKGFE